MFFGPFPFHFTELFFFPFCFLQPEWRKQRNQCQSKRGVSIKNQPNRSDTDESWRSDVWQMWKRSVVVAMREGTGTDLSSFDGSLKYCSECGAVISLTTLLFSLLCWDEHSLRGLLVTKHRTRLGERAQNACLHGKAQKAVGLL